MLWNHLFETCQMQFSVVFSIAVKCDHVLRTLQVFVVIFKLGMHLQQRSIFGLRRRVATAAEDDRANHGGCCDGCAHADADVDVDVNAQC